MQRWSRIAAWSCWAMTATWMTAFPLQEAEEQQDNGLRLHSVGAFQGYTLVAPYLATTTYLLDMQGKVAHQWDSDETPAGGAYLLEDGSLLRCADTENARFRSNGTGGRIQWFDWEGNLLWDYLVSDDLRMQNHDFEPLPNGNVLVAAWEYRNPEQAIAAGCDPNKIGEQGLWPCVLLEIQPLPPTGGKVVWEWNAWDHLVQDQDTEKENYGQIADHPELLNINGRPLARRLDEEGDPQRRSDLEEEMRELEEQMRALGYIGEPEESLGSGMGADFMHVNGVSYEPVLDLIVLSSWELSEILVIDHSTTTEQAKGHIGGRYGMGGDILYRWGNPQNYGAGDASDQQFFSQHDARWLPGPRITVFNNDAGRAEGLGETPRGRRGGRGRPYSTIDEIVLPFDPELGFLHEPGEAFGPDAPIWSYRASSPTDFYGSFISGAHRLPNGNTFICEGPTGRLFEVTAEHHIVWEYVIPFTGIPVGDFWARFGWGDMGMDMEGFEGDDSGDGFMVAQAAFRATRLAPDYPGLGALQR